MFSLFLFYTSLLLLSHFRGARSYGVLEGGDLQGSSPAWSSSALTDGHHPLHVHPHNKDVRAVGVFGEAGSLQMSAPAAAGSDQLLQLQKVSMDVSLGEQLKKALFKAGGGGGGTPPQEFSVAGMLKMTPIREPTCNETIGRLYSAICGKGDISSSSTITSSGSAASIAGNSQATFESTFRSKRATTGFFSPDSSFTDFGSRSAFGAFKRSLVSQELFQTERIMVHCCNRVGVHCSIDEVSKTLQDLCKPHRHGSRSVLNA